MRASPVPADDVRRNVLRFVRLGFRNKRRAFFLAHLVFPPHAQPLHRLTRAWPRWFSQGYKNRAGFASAVASSYHGLVSGAMAQADVADSASDPDVAPAQRLSA